MPYLKMSYTDRFGTTHPDALVEVSVIHLVYTPDLSAADYSLVIYHDQAAKDGGLPAFEERPPKPFTDAALAALRDQFSASVLAILQQQSEFNTSAVVP